ncbi:hypothetical protein AMECASPLE_015476 [Ameca splendens]|uniref:Uncharacterized protein n=1 Tax=Ameca splendens TaxID=208324 RepID=A0ABV0YD07_9TELE
MELEHQASSPGLIKLSGKLKCVDVLVRKSRPVLQWKSNNPWSLQQALRLETRPTEEALNVDTEIWA